MEQKGSDFVAHGGADLPEFAINMLAKVEALAAKAGYTDNCENSSTLEARGRATSGALSK